MKGRFAVAWGFLALIAVGALLLMTPWANVRGTWGDPVSATFTACSAVCVTGLSVVDIASEYTRAGQVVLLTLVELGCLGLMTFGTFIMIAIGRRLSLSREFSLMNAYGVEQVLGFRGLVCWVVGSMLAIEGLGALSLYFCFGDWWTAGFYSAMSFCNAGFSLLPDSVTAFAGRPAVLFVLAFETILGGIGFLVIYNLITFKFLRRKSGGKGRLSLHAKVVLRVSFILLVLAFAAFLLLEWNGALAKYGFGEKLWIGFYQAVTPRTCGFCVTPTGELHPLTRLVYEVLMFIGGAPGSAAAGIKVTTLAVLFYTLRAMCRSEHETVIYQRAVSFDTVRESIVIFMALVVLIVVITGALLLTDASRGVPIDALLFESISAITTTGLSMDDTTVRLSLAGKVVIMCAMFLGRLGALTVVLMIGDRESARHLGYPNEELVVG